MPFMIKTGEINIPPAIKHAIRDKISPLLFEVNTIWTSYLHLFASTLPGVIIATEFHPR
jgi:hypothetical protein